MCLAFGVESLDDVGERVGDMLEMQPPEGLAREGARAEEAEVDRRLAAEDRPQRRLPGGRAAAATRSTSVALPVQTRGRATAARSSRCPP